MPKFSGVIWHYLAGRFIDWAFHRCDAEANARPSYGIFSEIFVQCECPLLFTGGAWSKPESDYRLELTAPAASTGTKDSNYATRSQYFLLSPEHPRPRHQGTVRCSTYLCVPIATGPLEDFWSSCRSMLPCCVSSNGLRRLKDWVQC